MKAQRGLFWFRRDLRVQDHPLLTLAANTCSELSFVYVLDPRDLDLHPQLQIPRLGAFRRKFLRESLVDLRTSLEEKQQKLYFLVGDPEHVIPGLCEKYGFKALFCSNSPIADESDQWQKIASQLQGHTQCHSLSHHTIIEQAPNPLPVKFTDFRLAVEPITESSLALTPEIGKLPPQVTLFEEHNIQSTLSTALNEDSRGVKFTGGETAALLRLEDYVWKKDLLKTFKDTRNSMVGLDYSTKLSPWLALGCISPKRIAREVRLYEKTRVHNESTYWLLFELLWRDFFHFQAEKLGSLLFQFASVQKRPPDHRRGSFEAQLLRWQKWANAETGQPFVDATLSELNTTGFISNRARQIAASYLIYDLAVDWRWGAQYFESQLIDHDPCSNYGNWAQIAGTSADPRPVRRLDPLRQAELYDVNDEYLNLWGP